MPPGLLDLPDDALLVVVGKLPMRSLSRLMMTCRALRSLGKQSPRWAKVLAEMKVKPPTPRARKYKTPYDLVIRHVCRVCYRRPAGLQDACDACRRDFWLFYALRDGSANLAKQKRLLGKQQAAVQRWQERLEQTRGRLQAAQATEGWRNYYCRPIHGRAPSFL